MTKSRSSTSGKSTIPAAIIRLRAGGGDGRTGPAVPSPIVTLGLARSQIIALIALGIALPAMVWMQMHRLKATLAMLMEHFVDLVTDRGVRRAEVEAHMAHLRGDERFLNR